MSQGLTMALRAGFERELQPRQKRVKDVVAPFGAFVRTDGERLHALSAELEKHLLGPAGPDRNGAVNRAVGTCFQFANERP